jgi:hypothetical protein
MHFILVKDDQGKSAFAKMGGWLSKMLGDQA